MVNGFGLNKDNVYVGLLVYIDPIRDYSFIQYDCFGLNYKMVFCNPLFNTIVCRKILFKINDGLCNDLIFNIPVEYAVRGITPLDDGVRNFMVEDWVNLKHLLESEKYRKQSDINKIFNEIIVNRQWLKENKSLYGIRKDPDLLFGGSAYCGDEQVPYDQYEQMKKICRVKRYKPQALEEVAGHSGRIVA